MADRWPEPPINANDHDNPFEMIEKFKAHYQDIFLHTAAYPTATASAGYVMELMFQANKVITVLRDKYIADTSPPTPGAPKDNKNSVSEMVMMRKETPSEPCTTEPKAAALLAGNLLPEDSDDEPFCTDDCSDRSQSGDESYDEQEALEAEQDDHENADDDDGGDHALDVAKCESTPEQQKSEIKASALLAGDLLPEDPSDDDYNPEDDSDGSYSSDEYDYSDEDFETTDSEDKGTANNALEDQVPDGVGAIVDEVMENVIHSVVADAIHGDTPNDKNSKGEDTGGMENEEDERGNTPEENTTPTIAERPPHLRSVETVPTYTQAQRQYDAYPDFRIRWYGTTPPYRGRRATVQQEVHDMLRLALTKSGNPALANMAIIQCRAYAMSGDVDVTLRNREDRDLLVKEVQQWLPFVTQSNVARIIGVHDPCLETVFSESRQDVHQEPCGLSRIDSKREKRRRQKQRRRERLSEQM